MFNQINAIVKMANPEYAFVKFDENVRSLAVYLVGGRQISEQECETLESDTVDIMSTPAWTAVAWHGCASKRMFSSCVKQLESMYPTQFYNGVFHKYVNYSLEDRAWPVYQAQVM